MTIRGIRVAPSRIIRTRPTRRRQTNHHSVRADSPAATPRRRKTPIRTMPPRRPAMRIAVGAVGIVRPPPMMEPTMAMVRPTHPGRGMKVRVGARGAAAHRQAVRMIGQGLPGIQTIAPIPTAIAMPTRRISMPIRPRHRAPSTASPYLKRAPGRRHRPALPIATPPSARVSQMCEGAFRVGQGHRAPMASTATGWSAARPAMAGPSIVRCGAA
jgi:hypothetical protein